MPKRQGISARHWVWFHTTMAAVWAVLAIPTVLLWPDSILWVAFMSLYANFIGHWSAVQAARAEKMTEESNA